MKFYRRFVKKNPTTLNIPLYSIGGSVDRINFLLNSMLLIFIFSISSVQSVSSFWGYVFKYLIVFFILIFQVNNVLKRFRDITGKEIAISDKLFFSVLTIFPFVNITLFIYLSYKIGYLEIIKRRNALLREMT